VTVVAEIPLVGAGGEPVDFARTIVSHGVAELSPNHVDLEARALETTLSIPGRARTVRLTHAGGKLASTSSQEPPVRTHGKHWPPRSRTCSVSTRTSPASTRS
jgi:hypothetical protein